MLELGGGGDLLDEAVGAQDGRKLRLQDLDGHLALMLEVRGQIHGGHAALPQLPLDPVAVREGGGQAVHGHAHEPPAPFNFARNSGNQSRTRTSRAGGAALAEPSKGRIMMNRRSSGVTA